MARKQPGGRARRPQARPRDARGRFLSRRAIAAVKGWQTRRTAARVEAAKHGERARRRTEGKRTQEQIERARRDARRVTQKVRRAKKDSGTTAARGRSSRLPISPRLKGRSKKSTPKRQPSTEFTVGGGDQFAAQIRVRFKMPAGFTPTQDLVREAIRFRIDEGHDAPRVKTRILRWRNPGRRHGEDRAWRQGNQPDAWNTLANVIRAAIG